MPRSCRTPVCRYNLAWPKGFRPLGTVLLVALAVTVCLAEASPSMAATTTIPVGNNWFGNAGSQGGVFQTSIDGGSSVEWAWTTSSVHNITESDASFNPNSGTTIGSSSVATVGPYGPITIEVEGNYYYFCSLHPDQMRGEISVAGNGVGTGGSGGGPGLVIDSATALVRVGAPEGERLFEPAVTTISAGDTVTWAHAYGEHDVTSASPAAPRYQSLGGEGGMPERTTSFSRVFNTPGVYTYYCTEHADEDEASPGQIDASIADGEMVGKIVVVAPDTQGPSVSNLVVSPNPATGVDSVRVSALITDAGNSRSAVVNAEAFIGSVGVHGSGQFLPVADGVWNEAAEMVSADISILGLPVGTSTIFVHGQDQRGNWGPAKSISLTIEEVALGGEKRSTFLAGLSRNRVD